jgi:mannose-1-phosphate guanylyltransferase
VNVKHDIPSSLSHLEVVVEEHQNETAVAILRACKVIKSEFLISFHADHYIENEEQFVFDIKEGLNKVGNENVVIYGLEPTSPDPRYGYVIGDVFIEKPSIPTAISLINQGALWNSGIFASSTKNLTKLLETNDEIQSYYEFPRFGKAPSFDVAVLQNLTEDTLTVQKCGNWDWEDVGVWTSFIKRNGNGNFVNLESENILIHSDEEGEIAVVGCKDLVVVRYKGKLLILNATNGNNELLKKL